METISIQEDSLEFIFQKLLKVSDTLSTLNENFNAGIKLFQNSNCFILNHYIFHDTLRPFNDVIKKR